MELNSGRILENYLLKKLDKQTARNQLLTLISNSSDLQRRIEGIHVLETIGFEGEVYFGFFENLMISDFHPKIRKLAIRIIRNYFLRRAFEPMCWAYKHEGSIECLLETIVTLGRIEGPLTKEYLITQLLNIDLPEFQKYVLNLRKKNQLQPQTTKDLAEILLNYHIMYYLLEKFKRIQYKIHEGRIRELNLSFIIFNVYDPDIIGMLPHFFQYLTSLITLDLQLNKFTTLPRSIVKVPRLKTLNISHNNFRYLPDYFSNLHALRHLDLNYNSIRYLPKNFGELINLRSLKLKHNQLMRLPLSFKELQHLEFLNLHGNELEQIPKEVFELRALVHLELGLNEIREIPHDIQELSNLRKLCVGCNRISQKSLQRLMQLENLRELDLYDNKLKELPRNIARNTQLTSLSLHNNQLNSLPKSFKNLQSLESLDLSWNNFKRIPEEIHVLKKLKYLNLSGNKIDLLPTSLSELSHLNSLNLIYNDIDKSSESLAELKRQGINVQI